MKNKIFTKALATIICLTMFVQITPVSVLATNINLGNMEDISEVKPNTTDEPKIVSEVVEERDEFSKVYLLEDGTYYSVTTYAPIHELVNGEWQAIDEEIDASVRSIDEIENKLQQASVNYVYDIDESNVMLFGSPAEGDDNSSLTINYINATQSDGDILFEAKGMLLAKPQSLYGFLNKNMVILSAEVSANCAINTGHRQCRLDVRELSFSWDENTSSLPSGYAVANDKLIDAQAIKTANNYKWNITDLYSTWDRENDSNNGFVLTTTSNYCRLTLSSLCISVRYKNLDETDLDSTYHTVDMGRAGTVYINDITNTVKVEQDILNINRTNCPISLKRIYNLVDAASTNSAGRGFRWSYESDIAFDGEKVKWRMFDGTSKYFTESEETQNGYTKFTLIGRTNLLSIDDSVMWVKTDELSNTTYNYSNFYAEIGNEKYTFDATGRLIRLQVGTNALDTINFTYSNNNLISVSFSDDNGSVTTISFSFPINGSGYVYLETKSGSSNTVEQQIVLFSTQTDTATGITTNIITYNDQKQVIYKFNSIGELLGIIDEDGMEFNVEYLNNDGSVAGNRIAYCEKASGSNGEYAILESLSFDIDSTYHRNIINEDGKKELIQYDNQFNVIAHNSFNGDWTFAEYDENDLLSSYVVDEESAYDVDINGGFEEYEDGYVAKWDSKYYSAEIGDPTQMAAGSNYPDVLTGDNYALFTTDTSSGESVFQDILNLKADTTYVFGGWIKIFAPTPVSTSKISINIKSVVYDEELGEEIETIIKSIEYDLLALNTWQHRLAAFKLSSDQDIRLSIDYEGSNGAFCADDIVLYEASMAQTDMTEVISTEPYITNRNSSGLVESETLTNGITSLVKSYEYENDQISAINDINGITTYYDYNENTGYLEKIGTLKSGDTIVNPTEFTYSATGARTEIEQIVTGLTNNEPITMSTQYQYESDRISQVTHNGMVYEFYYDALGNLTNVNATSTNATNTSGEVDSIEYTYNDNDIGEISYKNGLIVRYHYNDGKIDSVKYYNSENQLLREIGYENNSDGFLVITDSATDHIYEYNESGYDLYINGSAESPVMLYSYKENTDGSVTETYMPEVYKINDENKVFVTTGKTTETYNTETEDVEKTSILTINKVKDWGYTNPIELTSTYERHSVTDYFGRMIQKSIESQNSNNTTEKAVYTEDFEYKELSDGISSTQISAYTTKLDMTPIESGTSRNTYYNKAFYEYDHNGNVVYEYSKNNNGAIVDKKYYEYDEAGQIIGEVNYENGNSTTYTYDAGGNLVSKTQHNISEVTVDSVTNKVTNYGSTIVGASANMTYDSNFKDRLISYNGTSISYDTLGNPINYVGKAYKMRALNTTGSDIDLVANLEWSGNRLSAFESDGERYEYEYDENGYRISKRSYYDDESGEWVLNTESIYIWDNGKLKSVIQDITDTNPQQSDIIYDQEGNMAGFASHLGAVILFAKDINGSVKRLIDETGRTIAHINYDAWGYPTIKINENTSTTQGIINYVTYSILALINPSTYNGYLFDYETGLYFSKDRIYSPSWGRYLNPVEYSSLLENTNTTLSANLYVFCNNNPVNTIEPYTMWSNNNFNFEWKANGFEVDTLKAFLSRPFCMIFANQIIMANGTYSFNDGFNFCGVNNLDIAQNLFAHGVGKHAYSAVNKVNAVWGDGWIYNTYKNNKFFVTSDDKNADKYEKIWYAVSEIKMYAWSLGIYITV